ncbi:FabA-like domain protein [Gilliamella apicola SCGC AB-598-I20]|jgi:3-hydroxymyristoyl/3-hydroxydecanoyl-(acyl carrier protein) dehydratases|nr:FabA-like domain protein [Gilliamella apicola SCGC AB-598-I20]
MKKELANEINITKTETEANIEITIPPDLFWFKGHFPTQPLLPGVTQLNWVIDYARKLFNPNLSIASIEVIKFQSPILPNDNLKLTLIWDEVNQKLKFTYSFIHSNNKIASTGRLTLCQ